MTVEIISPERKIYTGEANSVKVPGADGQFEMLNNHAPIISTLVEGTVVVKDQSGTNEFEVKGGVIEMKNNKLIILAD